MTCASCAARIERVLARQPGVESATVNLAAARARVRSSASQPGDLIEAVSKIGYGLAVSDPGDHTRSRAIAEEPSEGIPPAVWEEIVQVFELPSFYRADAIGAYRAYPPTRDLGEFLIDIEGDAQLRSRVARILRAALRE